MENPQNSFKGFDGDFDEFPKHLPDDCIEYSIYILDNVSSDSKIREILREIQSAATKLIKTLLKDFIWQRQEFGLQLVRENGTSFLQGRTNFGDSVEDEWLIVYLLRRLSVQYPDIWITAVDTDGQFLLIEAANALPKWLNPEIADNRLWLNRGQLLIIPMLPGKGGSQATAPDQRTVTLQQACIYIQEYRSQLLHSPKIEDEAFYRLRNYPQQINDSLHHTRAIIPRKLAYILHHDASYISPTVEAFYLRDPIALRPLQAQDSDDLVFAPLDMVTVCIKFTKVGYAQLKGQRFATPRSWSKAVPLGSETRLQPQFELGMKVACGFEMLLSDPHSQDSRPVREMKLLLEDLQNGEESLPSDSDMSTWEAREDSEDWLDINFEDFDRELSGRRGTAPNSNGGFGDKSAQENLRKMVARFEDFLNDDAAGSGDADFLDDMDNDDDEDEDAAHLSSEGEDKEVSFDEAEFSRMMKEMMGLPADTKDDLSTSQLHPTQTFAGASRTDVDESSEDDEEEIQRISNAMEVELKQAGALQLGTTSNTKSQGKQRSISENRNSAIPALEDSEEESEDDNELDIDFNLAKNMLESFKSQAGLPGPGGNLIGMMGMRLPRDEDDTLD